MIEGKSVPKPGEGTGLWLIKIVLGLLVVVFLIVHFIVNHFIGEGALLTWEDVVAYFSNPWIVAMEISFLVVVVSHALIGLRSILLDLSPPAKAMKVVDWVFAVVGVVSVVYGIWLALTVASFSA